MKRIPLSYIVTLIYIYFLTRKHAVHNIRKIKKNKIWWNDLAYVAWWVERCNSYFQLLESRHVHISPKECRRLIFYCKPTQVFLSWKLLRTWRMLQSNWPSFEFLIASKIRRNQKMFLWYHIVNATNSQYYSNISYRRK